VGKSIWSMGGERRAGKVLPADVSARGVKRQGESGDGDGDGDGDAIGKLLAASLKKQKCTKKAESTSSQAQPNEYAQADQRNPSEGAFQSGKSKRSGKVARKCGPKKKIEKHQDNGAITPLESSVKGVENPTEAPGPRSNSEMTLNTKRGRNGRSMGKGKRKSGRNITSQTPRSIDDTAKTSKALLQSETSMLLPCSPSKLAKVPKVGRDVAESVSCPTSKRKQKRVEKPETPKTQLVRNDSGATQNKDGFEDPTLSEKAAKATMSYSSKADKMKCALEECQQNFSDQKSMLETPRLNKLMKVALEHLVTPSFYRTSNGSNQELNQPPTVRVGVVGGPGRGKSFFLNKILGAPIFSSGETARGTGLTKSPLIVRFGQKTALRKVVLKRPLQSYRNWNDETDEDDEDDTNDLVDSESHESDDSGQSGPCLSKGSVKKLLSDAQTASVELDTSSSDTFITKLTAAINRSEEDNDRLLCFILDIKSEYLEDENLELVDLPGWQDETEGSLGRSIQSQVILSTCGVILSIEHNERLQVSPHHIRPLDRFGWLQNYVSDGTRQDDIEEEEEEENGSEGTRRVGTDSTSIECLLSLEILPTFGILVNEANTPSGEAIDAEKLRTVRLWAQRSFYRLYDLPIPEEIERNIGGDSSSLPDDDLANIPYIQQEDLVSFVDEGVFTICMRNENRTQKQKKHLRSKLKPAIEDFRSRSTYKAYRKKCLEVMSHLETLAKNKGKTRVGLQLAQDMHKAIQGTLLLDVGASARSGYLEDIAPLPEPKVVTGGNLNLPARSFETMLDAKDAKCINPKDSYLRSSELRSAPIAPKLEIRVREVVVKDNALKPILDKKVDFVTKSIKLSLDMESKGVIAAMDNETLEVLKGFDFSELSFAKDSRCRNIAPVAVFCDQYGKVGRNHLLTDLFRYTQSNQGTGDFKLFIVRTESPLTSFQGKKEAMAYKSFSEAVAKIADQSEEAASFLKDRVFDVVIEGSSLGYSKTRTMLQSFFTECVGAPFYFFAPSNFLAKEFSFSSRTFQETLCCNARVLHFMQQAMYAANYPHKNARITERKKHLWLFAGIVKELPINNKSVNRTLSRISEDFLHAKSINSTAKDPLGLLNELHKLPCVPELENKLREMIEDFDNIIRDSPKHFGPLSSTAVKAMFADILRAFEEGNQNLRDGKLKAILEVLFGQERCGHVVCGKIGNKSAQNAVPYLYRKRRSGNCTVRMSRDGLMLFNTNVTQGVYFVPSVDSLFSESTERYSARKVADDWFSHTLLGHGAGGISVNYFSLH